MVLVILMFIDTALTVEFQSIKITTNAALILVVL